MLVERISKPLTWGKLHLGRLQMGSLGNSFAERAARGLMVPLVVLGLFLRARGYLFSTISMWLDEAAWVGYLLEKPLLKSSVFRPIGFMAISKGLSDTLGPSEAVLRFMPWAAGIAATLMAPFIARRLFRSEASRLLFVAVLALDPGAIDLSKEFKPYSVGIALHAGILLLALRYAETRRTRDLAYLLALVFPASLFAQDSVFAYPGVFLLIAIESLRERRYRKLFASAGVAALTALLLGGSYYLMWRHIPKHDDQDWGRKYDIFYVEPPVDEASEPPRTKTDWVVGRYAELAKLPGERRLLWTSRRVNGRTLSELRSLDGVVWTALNFAGIALIASRKQWQKGLLLVLPLATMATLNMLGFWPFGPFRANAFVIVYMAGIASEVFDRNANRVTLGDLLPATALVLVPLFIFERGWHRQKEMTNVVAPSAFATVLDDLVSLQGADYEGPREVVIGDNWTCDPWRYYTRYNPHVTSTMGHDLKRRFRLLCRKDVDRILRSVRAQIRKGRRAWVVASNENTITNLERDWPEDLEKTQLVHVEGATHLIVGVARATPKPVEPPPPPPEEQAPESEESGSFDMPSNSQLP